MSATVAAALKKIVVAILTDKKARKVVLGIILGILIILVMPLAAIIAIFNGDINIDTNRLQTLVVQNLSAEEQAKLQRVEDLMYEIEDRMTEAGFDNQRVKEAQVLYVLALSDYSEADGFVDKLVGCFADGQTDAQLISAVNSAFGTNLSVDEFTKVMSAIRAVYISTAGYIDPSTKNNLDLVQWAKNAYSRGWGYVWGTYGQVLTRSLYKAKAEQYPDEVGGYADFIEEHWIGGRTADCIGLIKGYGYNVSVIDLRNPTRSNGNNLLHLVNKYMDLYQANPDTLVFKAKAEKYAKIISKTIILSGMDAASFGQNAYFYDAAEGLLTATILLVAEFCKPEERHIVSVFKIIQELLAPSGKKGKNQFQQLMEMLPNDHKAKWFAGAALNTAEQSMASVMSTALSRLNSFLDSELEQLLCFDTEIDAEKFCREKSAIFIIMPEENPNTFFMISLIIQQLYREILAVADENGGQLKNRCVFFCDEFGTLPKIESAEMMFSASRSRRLQIVPIIQSFAQLEKNYGKEGGEIIVDNTQITLFGGFAPNSSSADTLSKALGSRTVMSGSVSRSKNDPSESLQMMERPLLTPDELKSLPKGDFVVMKTGVHPMRVHLKLFFKWGIEFDKDHPYTVAENGNRKVQYANKAELMDGIVRKYHPEALLEGDVTGGGSEMEEPKQTEAKNHQPPKSNRSRSRQPKPLPDQTEKDGKKGGSQPSHKQVTVEPEPEPVPLEVSDGQA